MQSATGVSRIRPCDEENLDLQSPPKVESQKIDSDGRELNIVSWEGDDDPANPRNWPATVKWGNITIVSLVTIVTPLASSMFAPAVPQVMAQFHSNNEELASFVISVYVIGFALGPLVVAPLSELYGRLIIYHISNILFVAFTIGCALSSSIRMFTAFRLLSGCVGVTPMVLGGGSIADIIPAERRGTAMAIWGSGQLFGPVIGPIAGGYLNEAAGWRWIFWTLAIIGGVLTTLGILLLRETYAPVLLKRKAKKLRKHTGDPSFRLSIDEQVSPLAYFKNALIRPLRLLFTSRIVFFLSVDVSIAYGYLYLVFTTLTYTFEERYGFSSGVAGLTFLGIGTGMFIGLVTVSAYSDKTAQRKSISGDLQPEDRLTPLVPGAFLIPIGLFWYGWSVAAHIFWIVPLVGTAFFGAGLIATFVPVQMYLIDTFDRHAASALAALTILRSVTGATLPLAGQKLFNALGDGWGNSLLAFIALALTPIPFLFLRYGERLRSGISTS
ncbi:MFS general substrate transporter [Glonium stellatum]|uniref:MFS general substrate transporter n=1 Tax=Glonium stellatum TaxID=574774 RepID=A0A8E2JQ83_9PEZI|nr:MFS general substrate transporter [Glonium stellatum]